MRTGKESDAVTRGELLRAVSEVAASKGAKESPPRWVCPETGKALDGVSIRKHVLALYPDNIKPDRTNEQARQRRAALLKMADEQEKMWGGSAPRGSAVGEGY